MSDWTLARDRLLRRFYRDREEHGNDGSTVHCVCGASYTWKDLGGDPLCAWVDEHGSHMPPLPSEPVESTKPDATRALLAILDRIAQARATDGMNPYASDYCNADGCIEDVERLAREGLGEE